MCYFGVTPELRLVSIVKYLIIFLKLHYFYNFAFDQILGRTLVWTELR